MRLYLHQNVREGQVWPKAWLWHGRIEPVNSRGPRGYAMTLRLPWWVRKVGAFSRIERTYQLVFVVEKFFGAEEMFFIWDEIREEI